MQEELELYYNHPPAYDVLKTIQEKRDHFTFGQLANLYSLYKEIFEISYNLDSLGSNYKVFHCLPLSDEIIVDELIVSQYGVFIINYLHLPFKNVEVFGSVISMEESMNDYSIPGLLEAKSLLAAKLNISENNIYTILAVKSSRLSVHHAIPISAVISFEGIADWIVNNILQISEIDSRLLIDIICDPVGWSIAKVHDVSYLKLMKQTQEIFDITRPKNTVKRGKKRLVKIFVTLFLLLFCYTQTSSYFQGKDSKGLFTKVGDSINLTKNNLGEAFKQPVFAELDAIELCPDLSNCRVGERAADGGIIFYDAGTQEDWGRYLVIQDYMYNGFSDLVDKKSCNFLRESSFEEFTTVYSGGEEIMDVVNNNLYILKNCASIMPEYEKFPLEDISSYQYLLPTSKEAKLLSLYLSNLREPGSYNPKEMAIVTSTMSDKGLLFVENGVETNNPKNTLMFTRVRVENE